MFEDDYADYIPVTISSTSPVSPSKPRMPRISRRRFSLSLAESFNQLEIPFKPRRKSSVPATPSSVAVTPSTWEMDNAKLNYFARREVENYCEFIPIDKPQPKVPNPNQSQACPYRLQVFSISKKCIHN